MRHFYMLLLMNLFFLQGCEPNIPHHQYENPVELIIEEKDEQNIIWESIKGYLSDFQDRYKTYAILNPDLELEQVVLQVNRQLDFSFYEENAIRLVTDTDHLLVLCNKFFKLPSDYTPMDLEDIPKAFRRDDGRPYRLRSQANQAFINMAESAKESGVQLVAISAYRSYDHQQGLYNRYVEQHGKERADRFSARPGHSEHQTGLAVDLNWISEDFENTDAFRWLQKHAHEYGFILRYPKGQEHITGYMYEPWHYRYVGVETASYIKENNLLLEDYIALYHPERLRQETE